MKPIAQKLSDLLSRKAAPTSAAALRDALTTAEAARAELEGQQAKLAAARVELLVSGGDQELDQVERELANVSRALDRYEVQIPELRKRHARVREEENEASSGALFDGAVRDHLSATRELDPALAAVERIFVRLEKSAEVLRTLDGFHRASGIDAVLGEGRVEIAALQMSILAAAPAFARALQIEEYAFYRAAPLYQGVEAFWDGVSKRLDTLVEQRRAQRDAEVA